MQLLKSYFFTFAHEEFLMHLFIWWMCQCVFHKHGRISFSLHPSFSFLSLFFLPFLFLFFLSLSCSLPPFFLLSFSLFSIRSSALGKKKDSKFKKEVLTLNSPLSPAYPSSESVCLSIYLSFFLFIFLSFYTYLPAYLLVCFYLHLCVHICRYIYTYIYFCSATKELKSKKMCSNSSSSDLKELEF